jgi:hypothetical protein
VQGNKLRVKRMEFQKIPFPEDISVTMNKSIGTKGSNILMTGQILSRLRASWFNHPG